MGFFNLGRWIAIALFWGEALFLALLIKLIARDDVEVEDQGYTAIGAGIGTICLTVPLLQYLGIFGAIGGGALSAIGLGIFLWGTFKLEILRSWLVGAAFVGAHFGLALGACAMFQ